MTTTTMPEVRARSHPVDVHVDPSLENRNRLTTAFRFVLAVPHLLLVGGPIAATLSWMWTADGRTQYELGGGGGVLGAVAAVCALIAWFAILFTGTYPASLNEFGVGVLRWNTRVDAYLLLLRDEYPPFSLE